jgi:hypothetical protein
MALCKWLLAAVRVVESQYIWVSANARSANVDAAADAQLYLLQVQVRTARSVANIHAHTALVALQAERRESGPCLVLGGKGLLQGLMYRLALHGLAVVAPLCWPPVGHWQPWGPAARWH